MQVKELINWVLYGNPKGQPTTKGETTKEYDEFLKEVFNYNKKNEQTDNN